MSKHLLSPGTSFCIHESYKSAACPLNHVTSSSCTSSSSSNFFPARCFFMWSIHNVTTNSNNLFVNFRWTFTFCVEKSYDGMDLAFGGTLDRRCHFKRVSLKPSRFYQSDEHGSQVKDQGRRHCCHNKHKQFPYWPTRDVSLLSGHALYIIYACVCARTKLVWR